MRIAILSDIHGNRTAFEAVLKDLRETAPDLVFHGGDLADGGSSPVEIIDRIRDFGWPGVVGNTDEMLSTPEVFDEFARQRPHLNNIWTATREMAHVTREWLGDERLAWLRGLPFRQVQDSVHLVHAHPESCWTAPGPDATDTDLECYSVLNRPIAAYGHIHLPYIRKMSKLTVANSGSVGMPFDSDRRASYLLVDGVEPTLRRVEYDVDREIKALRECGLPHADWIARMLTAGSPQLPEVGE
jgi:putative phosphoesterase